MPDALRTATPMADWRSFKFTCGVSAGQEGIKDAQAADEAGDRHSYIYQVEDTVGALLESVDFGDEGVLVYHAEKIMVPKKDGSSEVFLPGMRVYWDPVDRLVSPTYGATWLWIGIATEPALAADLRVEINMVGDKAEVEVAI